MLVRYSEVFVRWCARRIQLYAPTFANYTNVVRIVADENVRNLRRMRRAQYVYRLAPSVSRMGKISMRDAIRTDDDAKKKQQTSGTNR